MPTVRLIPSTATSSNSKYLKITSISNMYTNTDSTTYSTVINSRSATTAYYLYIRGFNFNAVPSNAKNISFKVKIKIRHSGGYTSNTISLVNNTSVISGSTVNLPSSGSTSTVNISYSNLTWATIKGYGSNFGIRVNCRRNASGTSANFYVYGAEITVTYSLQTYVYVQNFCVNGASSGASTGAYTITSNKDIYIYCDESDKVTVTNNGSPMTLYPSYDEGDWAAWYVTVPAEGGNHYIKVIVDGGYKPLYIKSGSQWVQALRVYKKTGNYWYESDPYIIFDTSTKYDRKSIFMRPECAFDYDGSPDINIMNHNPFAVDVYYNGTNNNTSGTKLGSLSANQSSWMGDGVFDFRTFYYIYFVNQATGEKTPTTTGFTGWEDY